jgi:hypothetical protein
MFVLFSLIRRCPLSRTRYCWRTQKEELQSEGPGKRLLLEERKCKYRASWSKDARKERESMSLQKSSIPPIPPETVLVAKAALPSGNVYMQMRDELGRCSPGT